MAGIAADAPVWLITGGTSGFGLSLAKAAIFTGARVVAAGLETLDESTRAEISADRLFVEKLDVSDETRIASVVDECIKKFGRIDVLVNNAGYTVCGAME